MSAALEEKLPRLSVQEMLGTVRGAFNSPSLAAKFVPALLKRSAVQALYARYPARPSERALRLWSRAAAALFGERADLR